jgi:ATP-dependent DNA ligase
LTAWHPRNHSAKAPPIEHRSLAAAIAPHFAADTGILDGEIVSLDLNGFPQFEDLMFRRGQLFFVAF